MVVMLSIQPHQCLPPVTDTSVPQTSKATRQELLQPHPVSSLSPVSNETKPRLGKDEVNALEREFVQNPKPNTQTKRGFAEKLHVDLARINNWFQNRRAKAKQARKQEAYEAQLTYEAHQSSSSASTHGGFGTARSNSCSPIQSRKKRKTLDDEQGEAPDDQSNKPPRNPHGASSIQHSNAQRKNFACPFRKRNPEKYNIHSHRICALTGFTTIARLKEHLYRYHKAPPFCKRCWQVFETTEQREIHETAPALLICEIVAGPPPEGVKPDQQQQLKTKAKAYPGQTEQERWKDIYKMLFPGCDVASPYWEPIRESTSPPPSITPASSLQYDEHMQRRLLDLFSSKLKEIMRNKLQPAEAAVIQRLNLVGLLGECQDQVCGQHPEISNKPQLQVIHSLFAQPVGHESRGLVTNFTEEVFSSGSTIVSTRDDVSPATFPMNTTYTASPKSGFATTHNRDPMTAPDFFANDVTDPARMLLLPPELNDQCEDSPPRLLPDESTNSPCQDSPSIATFDTNEKDGCSLEVESGLDNFQDWTGGVDYFDPHYKNPDEESMLSLTKLLQEVSEGQECSWIVDLERTYEASDLGA